MPAQLSISSLIAVSINLSPLPAQAQNISDLLILGSTDVIDVNERMRTYTTITGVQNDFGAAAPEALAASLWFQQAPQPTELRIGRWAQNATSAKFVGGTLSGANSVIAPWNDNRVRPRERAAHELRELGYRALERDHHAVLRVRAGRPPAL